MKVIKGIYGDKTNATRGLVHDYLGMDLDYSGKGVVKISMIKYVDKILKVFPEEIGKVSSSLTSDHLFQVRNDDKQKLLPEELARSFHHSVASLLFLCMRARPDTQTAVCSWQLK